jgi:hypothetical protein
MEWWVSLTSGAYVSVCAFALFFFFESPLGCYYQDTAIEMQVDSELNSRANGAPFDFATIGALTNESPVMHDHTGDANTYNTWATLNLTQPANIVPPAHSQLADGSDIWSTVYSALGDMAQRNEPVPVDRRNLAVCFDTLTSCKLLYSWLMDPVMQTIVKAESLSLVGAEFFKVETSRVNGTTQSIDRHVLPSIPEPGALPRYGSGGQRLYSPDWTLSAKHNSEFINAVIIAVRNVQVINN